MMAASMKNLLKQALATVIVGWVCISMVLASGEPIGWNLPIGMASLAAAMLTGRICRRHNLLPDCDSDEKNNANNL